jgi:aspartokinase-like uncharacterized kinase
MAHNVLLAGGGPLAEQIRHLSECAPIEDVAAHWMCVDLLSITATLLHLWLPAIPVFDDEDSLIRRGLELGATIFSPALWLREREPRQAGTKLPCTWDATSDSIAGRLAILLAAKELVLLKSDTPRGPHAALTDLSEAGYVDAFLPRLGGELPRTRGVNLRYASFAQAILKP